jgi:hypothetical protein
MNVYQATAQPEFMKAARTILLAEWETLEDFNKDYDFFNKDMPDNEIMTSIYHVISYYEGVGVLVREGLLDIRLVALTMGGITRMIWEKFIPFIDEFRDHTFSRALDGTEYLYNELMRYMEEHPELAT